jgi:hypothetical protein
MAGEEQTEQIVFMEMPPRIVCGGIGSLQQPNETVQAIVDQVFIIIIIIIIITIIILLILIFL